MVLVVFNHMLLAKEVLQASMQGSLLHIWVDDCIGQYLESQQQQPSQSEQAGTNSWY